VTRRREANRSTLNHPLTIALPGRQVKGGKPSQKYGFHGEHAEFLESEQ